MFRVQERIQVLAWSTIADQVTCSRWTHIRCIGYGYDEDFNCQACSPRAPVSEPPASVFLTATTTFTLKAPCLRERRTKRRTPCLRERWLSTVWEWSSKSNPGGVVWIWQLQWLSLGPQQNTWIKWRKLGEFADHIVLQMLASILRHDIIIVIPTVLYSTWGYLGVKLVLERVLEDSQSMWHIMKRGNSVLVITKPLSPFPTPMSQHFQS